MSKIIKRIKLTTKQKQRAKNTAMINDVPLRHAMRLELRRAARKNSPSVVSGSHKKGQTYIITH